jgi:transcriptional regulator with XRE-family HTH domain
MSQQDLADATGIGKRTIGRIEQGESESGRRITILETYLDLVDPPAAPADDQAPLEPRTIERALRDATAMELLAELASRLATQEAGGRRSDQPSTGQAERYTWFKDDAPTARRDAEQAAAGDEPGQPGAAGNVTLEWSKTDDAARRSSNARRGGHSA